MVSYQRRENHVDYIGRKTWGAQYAAGSGDRPIPCAEAWLHHTVTLAPDLAFTDLNKDSVDDDERDAMRQIERIGQSRFGAGFSYNLAIMPSGRCYVGCGVRRIGTHTGGRNTKALGIVLVGDYSKSQVPAPMRASLVEVLRDAKRLGWLKAAKLNGGHRDLKNTGCPGDHAYALIGAVNAEAQGTAPAPAPAPTPPAPAPTMPRGDDMLIVKAPDDGRQFWNDRGTWIHIGPSESRVLLAGGARLVGEEVPDADRREFLEKRGVIL